jgi:hypothetical protein
MTIRTGTVDRAIAAGRRRHFDEGPFRGIADYLFESAIGEPLEPQSLIARQAPGWVLPVHFHMQHQFQVVLRGSGRLGKHVLTPGTVHYTSPQSAYGPIVAGDEGLDYFTLRVLTDKGAWYLPDARPFMRAGLFKEQLWGCLPSSADTFSWRTLIPLRDDGLGAWAHTGDLGRSIALSEPTSDAGRFSVVIRGRFHTNGIVLGEGGCVYSGPLDQAPVFTALEEKSELVVVQFPDHAVRNDVPPDLQVAPSARGRRVISSSPK